MQAAFQSSEGQMAVEDVSHFATGGVTLLVGEVQVYDPVVIGWKEIARFHASLWHYVSCHRQRTNHRTTFSTIGSVHSAVWPKKASISWERSIQTTFFGLPPLTGAMGAAHARSGTSVTTSWTPAHQLP